MTNIDMVLCHTVSLSRVSFFLMCALSEGVLNRVGDPLVRLELITVTHSLLLLIYRQGLSFSFLFFFILKVGR